MIPRRVQLAILLAFLLHGFFILTTRYRLSYDAYTHMLFANHYAENWFSLWEARWYTGFTVVSYPPLIHQLIAIFVPILGFDAAFAFILWIITTFYPLGIYAFSRIFVGNSAASYAALASAILLPIYVVAHIFGQLPFLASTFIALFGAASLNRYLREGGIHNLLLTVALLTTTMAAHHATLIIQPFLIFAVLVNHFAQRGSVTPQEQGANIFIIGRRVSFFTALAAITCIVVIWPFWEWGMHQTMQTPIDHVSRHDFFTDPLAPLIFFWPLYGPLVLIIPFLFARWPFRFLGLIISFMLLFLLGLGGTTSLPHFFFGDAWEWLTYDRFAFWACLLLTPFFGVLFLQLKHRWGKHLASWLIPSTLLRKVFSAITFSVFTVTVFGSWLTPFLFPVQPEPINMQPIVDFLKEEDRSQWRYLTFGFGDQFAYLNLLTKATTIDGSYHTARTLPELRESGIGQVDTVYWALKGIPAVAPILQNSGEHGVRWGFVNRKDFIPELKKNGWIFVKLLRNGIQVWENPQATLPKQSEPPFTPPINSLSWGVLPLLSFVTTMTLSAARIWPIQADKAFRTIHTFIVGLMPLSLCFWYYRTIADNPRDRVYFIYSSPLFFLSDALAVLAVILWISARVIQPHQFRAYPRALAGQLSSLLSDFRYPLFILLVLSSLSVLWSTDWRTSLYVALHFWLVFFLLLSIRDWRDAWRPGMLGFCAALSIQAITGFVEFALQSTAFLKPLDLTWPGPFDPSIRGVSVVQLADGLRVLRAYGTTPHPNILGGFVLLLLLGPASLFLVNKKPTYLAPVLFSLGIIIIGLTFSRSAWLGLMVFLFFLILKSKYLDRRNLYFLVVISLAVIALTLYPMRDLVFTRISNAPFETEQLSTFWRMWINKQALYTISQYPITGVGIGAFILHLASYAMQGASIEPAHNIPLLVGAELGILGLILVSFLSISIALSIVKAQTSKSVLASALLAGFGAIGLFDHYLWSLAPGRLMLALALGLWAESINDNGT